MADDKVEVTFGAKIDELVSGMQDMSSAVQDQLGKMNDSLKEMSDQSKKTADDIKASNDQAAASFKDFQDAVSDSLGAVESGISKVMGVVGSLTAVLGGGALFNEAIESTKKWDTEVASLSRTLGINMGMASDLNTGLRMVGSSAESYTSALMKLERQLRTNEKGLQQLRMTTRDSNGALVDGETAMKNAISTMQQYKVGQDQNIVSIALFGRGAAQIAPLLRLNNDVMAKARQVARDLGLEIGTEDVRAMHEYEISVNVAKLAVDSLWQKIGRDLIPSLEKLAVFLSVNLPAAFNKISSDISGFIERISSATNALARFLGIQKNNQGLTDANGVPIGANGEQWYEKGIGTGRAPGYHAPGGPAQPSISAGGPVGQNEVWGAGGTKSAPTSATDKDTGAGTDLMAQYEAELEKLKNSQSDLNAWSAAKDYEFWNTKLAAAKQGSAEWQEIWNKMADLYRSMSAEQQRIAEKSAQDQITVAKYVADMQKNDAETAIKVQQEKLNAAVAMDQMSASERATAEMALYDKEFTAALTAQYKELALIQQTGDASVAAQAKVYDQIEKLQNQHILKMQQTQNQYLEAEKKQWDGYADQVGNAMTSMLFHHQSMLQTMRSLTEKAISYVIDSLLKKLVNSWIAGEATKTAATQAGVAAQTAAETAGASTGMLANVGAMLKSITASAGETFAGIFGFLSPVMGPAAAGPAAAGEATVMSVASMVSASAAGGFDVPSGLSGLMQFHPREMMLPAPIADKVRNMTDQGGNAGGGADMHVHLHTSNDTESFARQLKNANSPLMKQIKTSFRDFHLRLR